MSDPASFRRTALPRLAGDRRSPRVHGFTLIECLIAGVILASFAAAIAAGVAQSVEAGRRGEDRRLAAQWLDEVFTRVDVLGPDRILNEGPVQGELDDRFSFELVVLPDEIQLDLYVVEATVFYPLPSGRTESVSAYTKLYDPAGSRESIVGWEDLQ